MLPPVQLAAKVSLPATIQPPGPESISTTFLDFQTGIPALLNAATIIAAAIMLVLIAIGGLQYMTANGNDEATAKARNLIFASLVGFALILGTWGIMHLVFVLVGYQFG